MSIPASLAEIKTLLTRNSETTAQRLALQNANAEAATQVANLSSKITELTGQLEAAKLELEKAKTESATHAAAVLTITQERDGAVAAKATAEAAVEGLKKNPSEQARVILAGMGVKLEDAPNASAKQTEKISRAEFNALSHEARNAFVRNGGKISE